MLLEIILHPYKLCTHHAGMHNDTHKVCWGMFKHPPSSIVGVVCVRIPVKWPRIWSFNLLLESKCDETLPKFIARKHPRKGENKKQRARTKVQASKQLKRGVSHGGKGTTKYRNLHHSHEAYQLKKGGGKHQNLCNLPIYNWTQDRTKYPTLY